VSTGPQLVPSASRPAETRERNWLPMAIAAAVVFVVAAIAVLALEHDKPKSSVTPINAPPDAYAADLPITGLAMSESSNLAGGKVTYLDGHVANIGERTVTGITVPVSAAPLGQGEQHEFRLIFDKVSPDWDGAYPEIRVLHVDTK